MRKLLAVLTAMLFPVFAHAQEDKPVQLADYVTFCLALWASSPDIDAKANALGLQSGIAAGAHVTIGKSTIQFYKAAEGNRTLTAVTTIFADGKEFSCDVNPGIGVQRNDLEAMERTLGLDGQILPLGAATIGYWKVPDRSSPVLLKALVSSRTATLSLQEFEASAPDATKRH